MLNPQYLGDRGGASTAGVLGCPAAERLVCELAQGSSLKDAAERLEFPYKKALRAVAEAERRVGFKLVEPGRRGYRLTDFGRLLVDCLGSAF